ncbi:TatD family hydrolase [Lactiplantibacillus mudanjiangensis]|uniref:DNAse (Putative) [Lactobacillus plantarum JDM1] n=1 Tax=Lactiplantibacillus mudanjiangensis TaxID=1296538 RepID=A0A660E9D4_9LACO|nr:TatD family hydrolase [Lactiplantibacillus mudanjiangensis]VDG21406.1 DNAse (putative) [Lactobacillus plantarum JDM1] [Lactiplantibacillus mudanjiangensis]VDG26088.1 DNAse (putative) [Lactobacillus plantarum JDM1] [Lactiplantibacillus mudanjiangensis]VDG29074.1 DNAse (putative) [Lactobacillus plantarum JDM1] [Lactiplantibacillus mudanjiangensis]VDG31591.1 DNAse (putative) [Lactobacillus plantarum JDM1] [Lactiplantibacillus mudanjiangensis]
MRIFDSHTHLNSEEFIENVPQYLAQARDLDVVRMAIVGSNTQLNADAIKLAQTYPELVAIVGWHPEDSKNYTTATETVLIDQLQLPEVVALGEIGLDYHWDTSPQDVQRKIFARQVAIAKDMGLPISVHNRDAFEDTYKILKAADIRDTGGVMHSFNGDPEWLKRFLDLGMHISYSGVASFKHADEVHESVKQTPLESLMVETDAPYLTPEPYRGKQNEPGYTRYVVEAVAKLRETTPEAIAAQTYQNAEDLFKIEED